MVKKNTVWVSAVAGVIVGGGFACLAVYHTDVGAVTETLKTARIEMIAAIVVLMYLQFVTKSRRWLTIMRTSRPLGSRGVLAITVLGYAFNMILPHVGEFSRSYFIKLRANYPASTAMFSIVIERMLDFFAVLTVFGISALYFGEKKAVLLQASIFLCLTGLAILGGVLLIVYRTETIVTMLSPLAQRFHSNAIQTLQHALDSARGMAASMRQPRRLASLVVYSLGFWVLTLLTIHASLLSVGIDAPLVVSGVILGTLVAGLILPTAPGQLGTTQLSFVVGAAALSESTSNALAASLIYSAITLSSTGGMAVWAYFVLFGKGFKQP